MRRRGNAPISLQTVLDRWAQHELGRSRALGGRRALDGFRFQIYLSLEAFFRAVLSGDASAQFVFDGLSDLANTSGDLIYLTQAKVTLDTASIKDAIEEALVVDEFLEAEYPELRKKFRFRFMGRRAKSRLDENPAELDAARFGVDPHRWDDLRHRILSVEISSSPRVGLAIQLWQRTRNPFRVVDECAGKLLNGIGGNKPSSEIAEVLLEIWNRERDTDLAPGRLLGVSDLTHSGAASDRIMHGVLPRPEDLVEGCFRDRPEALEPILRKVEETIITPMEGRRRMGVPIFWLSGSSGTGKSVLLLQTVRELMLRGHADTVNFLGSRATWLPSSIRRVSGSDEQFVVAIDDLYAPNNRTNDWLTEFLEIAFSMSWSRPPLIFTCGPKEQLRSFRKALAYEPEVQVIELRVPNLNREEQSAYHDWYQTRTGCQVSLVKESIFVAAAWTYELQRRERLTPDAFAARFDLRLRELGLQHVARAALAVNQYQLEAPGALFAGHEAALDQLQSEEVYRIAAASSVPRQGRFFHAAICRLLYDCLVESNSARERGEDLARAFGSMIEGSSQDASQFLDWFTANSGVGQVLRPDVASETLAAAWDELDKRGPRHEVLPLVQRWADLVQRNKVTPPPAAPRKIKEWLEGTVPDAEGWGLLFQAAWDLPGSDRESLFARGLEWLKIFTDAGPWNFIWQRLYAFAPTDSTLPGLGVAWLSTHPTHRGWGRVWQRLLPRDDLATPLTSAALEAIPVQPETDFDLPLWVLAEEKLAPPPGALQRAILDKLARVRSPYKMSKGVEFFLARLPKAEAAVESLNRSQDEVGWPYLWTELLKENHAKTELLPVGRQWLSGPATRNGYNIIRRRIEREETRVNPKS
ncbi:MAG: hypothetical protein ACKV22_22900 [Bryobacteraceae bacterium]